MKGKEITQLYWLILNTNYDFVELSTMFNTGVGVVQEYYEDLGKPERKDGVQNPPYHIIKKCLQHKNREKISVFRDSVIHSLPVLM